MINIEWFHRDEKLLIDFASIVKDKPDDLYDTEFVRDTLDLYWYAIRNNIFKYRVLPHMLLSFFGNWFFYTALKYEDSEEAFDLNGFKIYALGDVCIVLIAYNFTLELIQLFHRSVLDSYFNLWNVMDMLGLISTIFVTVHIFLKLDYIDIDALRVVAAVASWALLWKNYDWMRLYSETAFFVELLFRSIEEMKYFIGMLMISLFAFGVPMLLISFNWEDEGRDSHMFIKSAWRAYLIMLGEFPTSDWQEKNGPFLWANKLFFFAATLFVMITMLNMLIAILSDVFGKVYEKKDTHAREMKLKFVSEIDKWMLPKTYHHYASSTYLFIIQPT